MSTYEGQPPQGSSQYVVSSTNEELRLWAPRISARSITQKNATKAHDCQNMLETQEPQRPEWVQPYPARAAKAVTPGRLHLVDAAAVARLGEEQDREDEGQEAHRGEQVLECAPCAAGAVRVLCHEPADHWGERWAELGALGGHQ